MLIHTYVFEGNSQSLDHILVSDALVEGAEFDAVHINAEFATQASDHDPLVASLMISDEDDELLAGGNGTDDIDGADGDDLVTGGNGDDVLAGGSDDDELQGGNGADRLVGDDAENPRAGFDAGNDLLDGGNGDDELLAGAGDDVLIGGKGDDTLSGGEGGDVFVFVGGGSGRDTITDFVSGEDQIDLGALGLTFADLDTDGSGLIGAGDRDVTVEGGLILKLDGSTVVVSGVTSLTDSDLLLS